jgi:diacylglycerol kinase family enzyme
MSRVFILFNNLANNGKGGEQAKKVEEYLQGEYVYEDITKIEDVKAYLSGLEADDEVVVCGGDGTISRFANDTKDVDYKNNIYFYPCGSGNDFYREIGDLENPIPVRVEQYIKNLPTVEVKGKTYTFLNGVGYGVDGYCCEVGDQYREKGEKDINYTSIAIKGLLFHYKATNAKVTVDGKEYNFKKVWIAPTMNGKYYGGGMIPAPNQKRLSDDKIISVMVFGGWGRIRTLMAFPSIFKGEHVYKKCVTVIEGKDIKVEFDGPRPLQIDGETILGVTSYEAKV